MIKLPNGLFITFYFSNFAYWNFSHCLVLGIWDLVLLCHVQINSQLNKNQGLRIHLPVGPDPQPACHLMTNGIVFRNLKSKI